MTPEIEQAFACLRYGADLDLEDLQWLELIHKKYTAIYEAERKLQETVVALEKAETKAQALKEKVKKQQGVIERMAFITRNSHGVEGWHLNGDMAPWEELIEQRDLVHWR